MLQVFDKDEIGGDVDTAAVRIALSNQCLLALRSVGCNVNGVNLTTSIRPGTLHYIFRASRRSDLLPLQCVWLVLRSALVGRL